jgi:hypothetical protein
MQHFSTTFLLFGFTALLVTGCSVDETADLDDVQGVSITPATEPVAKPIEQTDLYRVGQKRLPVSQLPGYEIQNGGALKVDVVDIDVVVSPAETVSISGAERLTVAVDFTPLEIDGDPTSMFLVTSLSSGGEVLPAPYFVTLNRRNTTYEIGERQTVSGVFGREAGAGIDRVIAQGTQTNDLLVYVNPMRNGLGSSFNLHSITITPE